MPDRLCERKLEIFEEAGESGREAERGREKEREGESTRERHRREIGREREREREGGKGREKERERERERERKTEGQRCASEGGGCNGAGEAPKGAVQAVLEAPSGGRRAGLDGEHLHR